MTSDQEPRYRLVDANGNIVGSLYGKPDGSVAIQETASGADREVTLAPDGTFSAPSVETESVTTEDSHTKRQNDYIVYSDQYDTLQDAIDEAPTAGEVKVTDKPDGESITINDSIDLRSPGRSSSTFTIGETTIEDDWVSIYGLSTDSTITVNERRVNLDSIRGFSGGEVVVTANQVNVYNCVELDGITFESGTSGGHAYANRDTPVTDNGNNEILSGS